MKNCINICFIVIEALLFILIVCVLAIEEIFVNGQIPQDMIEQGRRQYQLLQERSNIPKYGSCWKSAIEHVEEGCRTLSEETQSDVALHLTNCFLEESGHEIYNCVQDKKPNLRAICINSMTDRAFNVYLEFYTHTQNMCWFLRGQVWYETIVENTSRVGKLLATYAKTQEEILHFQQESLQVQEKLLQYSQSLEILMKQFHVLSEQHQEILSLTSQSLGGLQSWLIGELSWFELTVFYVSSAILILIFTSSVRTVAARFPLSCLLLINACMERFIYRSFSSDETDIQLVQNNIYRYVWWCRNIYIALSMVILMYKAFSYEDLAYMNNKMLKLIYEQNVDIIQNLGNIQNNNKSTCYNNGTISYIKESPPVEPVNSNVKGLGNNFIKSPVGDICPDYTKKSCSREHTPLIKYKLQHRSPIQDQDTKNRYNLRHRQDTPDTTN